MSETTIEVQLQAKSTQIHLRLCAYLESQCIDYIEQSAEDELNICEENANYHIACYFEASKPAHQCIQKLFNHFDEDQLVATIHELDSQIWQKAWKEKLTDLESKKFWLRQLGEPALKSELTPIFLEKSEAFGTGQHATTMASLEIVESLTPTHSVLDVGTGTGILAIACHKLGYKRIVATDIDPTAVESARKNLELNQTEAELLDTSFPNSPERFDLVIANILLPELLRLVPELISNLSDGGYLVLSGFHEANEHLVVESLKNQNFEVFDRSSHRSWLALGFKESSSSTRT